MFVSVGEQRSNEAALRETLRRREVDAARAAADEARFGQELRARLQRDLDLRGRQPRCALSSSATPPLTTAADMLVPLNR